MDALQAWGMVPFRRFIVSGHSKRGVAAYMAGALDSRVAAIIPVSHPINFDKGGALNYQNLGHEIEVQMYYRSVGTPSISGDALKMLEGIIDPYFWMDNINIPTLYLQSAGDPNWTPDWTHLFWEKYPQPKYMYLSTAPGHVDYEIVGSQSELLEAAEAFISG